MADKKSNPVISRKGSDNPRIRLRSKKEKKQKRPHIKTRHVTASSGQENKKSTGSASPSPISKRSLFPIVAIGASAGGLEAYKTFLSNMASDTGMAFVLIQHLSPDFKSMLFDILKEKTDMELKIISNNMVPAPNKIYLIPPKYIATIQNGIFYLQKRKKKNKISMPIDIFMRSLAEDHLHYSIGVIMSGADSDGVIGCEYIKTSGGITFAQNNKTAKFYDMPNSAIKAGVIDYVLAPEAIAREIKRISLNLSKNIEQFAKPSEIFQENDDKVIQILNILHKAKNIDFRQYKLTTVRRRILRRILLHKLKDINSYISFLKKNFSEIEELCQDILINVTSFFRNPDMYKSLKSKVFPLLVKKRELNEPIRIWTTACSTGEEAYSIAIALVEFLGAKFLRYNIQIFSTDLSDKGVEIARKGIYSQDIRNDVSADRLRKFFTIIDGKYQINKNIREMCVFARQDLTHDPPFSNIDLISCRNVLIYLGKVLQNKIFPIFHYALKPSGFLVLGSSETVGNFKNLFETVDRKNKIYKKNPSSQKSHFNFNGQDLLPFSTRLAERNDGQTKNETKDFHKEAETILLKKYTPVSVVINKLMEVVHIKGNIERYLDIPQGRPTFNIIKNSKNGLQEPLKNLINFAREQNKIVRKNNIHFFSNGQIIMLNIIIEPFKVNSSATKYFLVLFENKDTATFKKGSNKKMDKEIKFEEENTKSELAKMSKQLELNKENLQFVIEQQESTNEELRSANEEIQSSNEELQSTNEELQTTKEELESTNEELVTVNEELQNRNTELDHLNSDLYNILASIRISIVMLDDNLRIKRFTSEAVKLLNMIPTDVGRKITDINPNFNLKNLKELINEVIETPVLKEVEVKDNNNCWYSMKIRPYKTIDNKIEGVIITFIDITELKESLENQAFSKQEMDKLNSALEKRVEERTSLLAKMNTELGLEITDRKNAEATLRLLSKNLVDVHETERLKLSRELHDSVNQMLLAAKLKLRSFSISQTNNKNHQGKLKNINDATNYLTSAIEEIRRLSQDLRPATLTDIGIIASIKLIIKDFEKRNKIKISVKFSRLERRLSPEIELTLYRISQECLHNIEKHSKANHIRLHLVKSNNSIKLSVFDNGKGISNVNNFLSGLNHKKLGLLGIKERVETVGGTLSIRTEKGLGTRIDITIPLKNRNGQ